ncbi:MAG: DUF1828 domain-containing protein [Beijerinckiaceae bacterium]
MHPEELKKQLCSTFCGAINVQPVSTGYAISSAFEDTSGDRISFYLTPSFDGYQIEDDGSYLAHLIARDIPITQGTRGQLLDAILSQGNAYWDKETFEIKTPSFAESEIPRRVVDFLSSMIRVRDLELITREVVRSTFREDATESIKRSFGTVANLNEDEAIDRDFSEFPADLVIRPKPTQADAKAGAVYFINTNDKLNEALLLQIEAVVLKRDDDFVVIALIEDPEMKVLSRKKFQRAQNRSLTMPIFRGDEDAAMSMIGRRLNLPLPTKAA